MRIKAAAAAALTATLVLAGCEGDDDVFDPGDGELAAVAGSFEASSFAFTSADATVDRDLVANGGEFGLELRDDGRFATEFRRLATDPPQQRTGTFRLTGEDRITFDDDPFTADDVVAEREFEFVRNGSTLMLTDDAAEFDFDDDDVMDPAEFRAEFATTAR